MTFVIQMKQSSTPILCRRLTGARRGTDGDVEMVAHFMEQDVAEQHVTSQVDQEDVRWRASDGIVDDDFNERRRSAVFSVIEAPAGVSVEFPASYTPGLSGTHGGGVREHNRPKVGEVLGGRHAHESLDGWPNPSRRLVIPVSLVNRRQHGMRSGVTSLIGFDRAILYC